MFCTTIYEILVCTSLYDTLFCTALYDLLIIQHYKLYCCVLHYMIKYFVLHDKMYWFALDNKTFWVFSFLSLYCTIRYVTCVDILIKGVDMSSIHLVRSPHTCLKHFISDYNPSRDLDVARDCGTNLHQQIC